MKTAVAYKALSMLKLSTRQLDKHALSYASLEELKKQKKDRGTK